MTNINPYINFEGNAEEAMNFYRSVFGGEFMGEILRWGAMPCGDGEYELPEEHKNKIMHISLPISDGNILMASDIVEGLGPQYVRGNNITIGIAPDSREEADRLFAGLSEGGNVQMSMEDAFWGDYFGSFEDKFGINWLINVAGNAANKE